MSPFSSESETQAFLPRIPAPPSADVAAGRRGQSHSSDRWQRMERIKANRHRGLSAQDDLRGEWADNECKLKWDRMRRDRSARRGDRGRPARSAQPPDEPPPHTQRPHRLPELANKPDLTPIDAPPFFSEVSFETKDRSADVAAPTVAQFAWSFGEDEDDVDAPIESAAPAAETQATSAAGAELITAEQHSQQEGELKGKDQHKQDEEQEHDEPQSQTPARTQPQPQPQPQPLVDEDQRQQEQQQEEQQHSLLHPTLFADIMDVDDVDGPPAELASPASSDGPGSNEAVGSKVRPMQVIKAPSDSAPPNRPRHRFNVGRQHTHAVSEAVSAVEQSEAPQPTSPEELCAELAVAPEELSQKQEQVVEEEAAEVPVPGSVLAEQAPIRSEDASKEASDPRSLLAEFASGFADALLAEGMAHLLQVKPPRLESPKQATAEHTVASRIPETLTISTSDSTVDEPDNRLRSFAAAVAVPVMLAATNNALDETDDDVVVGEELDDGEEDEEKDMEVDAGIPIERSVAHPEQEPELAEDGLIDSSSQVQVSGAAKSCELPPLSTQGGAGSSQPTSPNTSAGSDRLQDIQEEEHRVAFESPSLVHDDADAGQDVTSWSMCSTQAEAEAEAEVAASGLAAALAALERKDSLIEARPVEALHETTGPSRNQELPTEGSLKVQDEASTAAAAIVSSAANEALVQMQDASEARAQAAAEALTAGEKDQDECTAAVANAESETTEEPQEPAAPALQLTAGLASLADLEPRQRQQQQQQQQQPQEERVSQDQDEDTDLPVRNPSPGLAEDFCEADINNLLGPLDLDLDAALAPLDLNLDFLSVEPNLLEANGLAELHDQDQDQQHQHQRQPHAHQHHPATPTPAPLSTTFLPTAQSSIPGHNGQESLPEKVPATTCQSHPDETSTTASTAGSTRHLHLEDLQLLPDVDWRTWRSFSDVLSQRQAERGGNSVLSGGISAGGSLRCDRQNPASGDSWVRQHWDELKRTSSTSRPSSAGEGRPSSRPSSAASFSELVSKSAFTDKKSFVGEPQPQERRTRLMF